MAETGTLHDAFIEELRDAYDGERQLTKALTKLAKTARSPELRDAFQSHLEETQGQIDRLEQVFETRVSRALSKLGVPGRKDLDELLKRVDELNREVRRLNGGTTKSLGQVMTSTVRRARDDLSDLARELEEAQLAAKQSVKRTVDKVKKSMKTASR